MASFKTEKTLRVHDGLSGLVSTQEQMCALENLRIWEEEETGGVLALIHFSALFGAGYLKFYLNNAKWPISLKDEGGRLLRIKGLRIRVDVGRGQGKALKGKERGLRKTISAKVEFTFEADKVSFMQLVKDAQMGMVDVDDA